MVAIIPGKALQTVVEMQNSSLIHFNLHNESWSEEETDKICKALVDAAAKVASSPANTAVIVAGDSNFNLCAEGSVELTAELKKIKRVHSAKNENSLRAALRDFT